MTEAMQTICNLIKAYDKILIFRHFRPDGDAVGSTKGLAELLRLNYPEKRILLQNADFSDYVSFLGDEDALLHDEEYADALGIVLDTATADRVSNPKFKLCREIVKIDHHIPVDAYGTYEWIEEHRCSASEMIAALYESMKDEWKINTAAATYIYTGIVTDSGRFRFRSVSGDTMRLAGMLLEQGIDTDTLYANLYLREFHTFKFESYVHEKMKISENGVASIYLTEKAQEKFSLSREEASASISYMDSIKNCLIWIALIENGDGSIRVRLRSRFVTINQLAERYHGGGHACACGATVYSRKEANALLREADALLKDYKETHTGWL